MNQADPYIKILIKVYTKQYGESKGRYKVDRAVGRVCDQARNALRHS